MGTVEDSPQKLREALELANQRIGQLEAAKIRAETLFEVAQVLGKSLNAQDTFDAILGGLQKVVPYNSSSIQVIRNGRLEIVGGRGFDVLDSMLGLGFELDDDANPSIQVLESRRQQVFADVSNHPHFASQVHGGGMIRGWICAPLMFGDEVIGVLTLDKFEADFYTEEHADLVTAFAAQAATAIENARLFETESTARKQADTLRAVAQSLGSTLNLQQVFSLILTELRKVVPYDSCSVQQIAGDEMVIVGGHGFPNLDELIGQRFNWGDPDDPATDVVLKHKPIIIENVSARFEHFNDETHGEGSVKGWMGVPLLFGERLIGMITLDHKQEAFYTQDHADVAMAFAAQSATAIENARLFETEREARNQADTLTKAAQSLGSTLDLRQVFDLILSELRRVIPYDSGSIQQIDGKKLRIVGANGFPNVDEVIGQSFDWGSPDDPATKVLKQREPVIVSDVSQEFSNFTDEHESVQVKGWMGVPLIFGDQLIGMITLDSLKANFYTQAHARLAEAFAAYAASAIENARLLHEARRLLKVTEKRAVELGAIGKISQALVAESELDNTIELIGNQVREIFDADIAYVALVDEETDLISFPYKYGVEFETLVLGEGLTSKIIESGKPLLMNKNVSESLAGFGVTLVGEVEPLSYLAVPIQTTKGTIGVISVQSTRAQDRFGDEELRLLTTIAANAGAALHNAQLFSEALEHLRQVEALTNAASAIEKRAFEPEMIDGVAARTDALGELARVFRNMAQEVRAREQRLFQQLHQLQLDIEEKELAKAETLGVYMPIDRRHALTANRKLPEHVRGAALFADISGFTSLTEALAQEIGLQRGAEEVIRHLNRVFSVLITEVHRFGGCVIGFSGDAITCWFDDLDANGEPCGDKAADRAVACALAMQAGMTEFETVLTHADTPVELAIKVAVAAGTARRILVGQDAGHQFDVLAGQSLQTLSAAEHQANKGEIIVARVGLQEGFDHLDVVELRENGAYAVVSGLKSGVADAPWAELPSEISEDQARPWMLPTVFDHVRAGKSDMLSELRPVAALFLKFGGLDYDQDPEAALRLDAFFTWVGKVVNTHGGSVIQVTVGDKGSYLYIAFGAPLSRSDDAVRATLAAMELSMPPAEFDGITDLQIGLACGQMRVGAYGGAAQRTYGAIGDKTNLAARLMQAAGAELSGVRSAILCDVSIFDAASSRIQFQAIPPIRVKGKADPVQVYRPLRLLAEDAPRGTVVGQDANRVFDSLAPDDQLVLKAASVIGVEFAAEVLAAIFPEANEDGELQDQLAKLRALDVLIQISSEPLSYRFADPILRNSAYELMLFAQRRQLHRTLAEHLLETDEEPPYAEIAFHWEASDDIPKAVSYLEKAGMQARDRGDLEGASQYFSASLALTP
jgi:GAF domain-containing protein